MRTDLAADFLAEMARNGSEPFITARIGGEPGTRLYIADRAVTIGGQVHEVIVPAGGFGAFASLVQGTVSRSLDIGALDIRVTNQPVLVGSPFTGWRMSEVLGPTFAARPVKVYQNFKKADGTYATQALLFEGYIRNPLTFDQVRESIRVVSMYEFYCSRSVLKIFEDVYFPFMRRSDIGTTLPIIFGQVRRATGRVIKRNAVSTPAAAVTNSTTAQLDAAIATALAGVETFTLTFSQPETVAFTGAGNTDDAMGATTPRTIYAQSFQTVGAQSLLGFTARLKSGGGDDFVAFAYICSDSAGLPGAVVGLAARMIYSSENTYDDRAFTLTGPVSLLAATKYWLVIRHWGSPAGSIYWQSASGGGFAGGNGKAGTYAAADDFAVPGLPAVTWNSTRDAYDYRFALNLASGAYAISGSVTGADGTGSTSADSTSSSGKVTIPAAAWQGSPAGGDIFTFRTDPGYPSITLFGQANETNLAASSWLQRIWWNDEPIGLQGANIVHTLTAATSVAEMVPPFTYLGQTIRLTKSAVLKTAHVSLQKNGAPAGTTLWLQVFEADATGTIPSSNAVLAAASIPIASIGGSAFYAFDFTWAPILLKAGKTYVFAIYDPVGGTAGNAVGVHINNTNAYAGGNLCTKASTSEWLAVVGSDMGIQLDAATWTGYQAGPDISPFGWDATRGVPVLWAAGDVAIPDDVMINGDITTGLQDDVTGTITGARYSSITIPDHAFHWLLRNAGAPDANIDLAGSFAAAHARFGSVYRFNGVVQDQCTYDVLFQKLGRECRCSFDWPVDKAQLNWLRDASDTPVATFTPSTIVANAETGVLMLSFDWSNTREIVNSIDARWSRDPHLIRGDAQSYRRTTHREDGASIVLFGKLEVPGDYFYDFVDSDAMATALADYALGRLSLPKRLGRVTTKLPFFNVQKADSVAFNLAA